MSTTAKDYLNTNTQGFIEPDGGQSTATTPGLDIPGTFQKSWHKNEPSNGTTGSGIAETAQGTLASAQHAAEQVLLTAEQTARQYLPQSVLNRLQVVGMMPGKENDETVPNATIPNGKPSLPSQDSESIFEPTDVGGVGSLPGEKGEEGVTVLPHEKEIESQKYPPRKTTIESQPDTSGQAKQRPSLVVNDPGYEHDTHAANRATLKVNIAAHPDSDGLQGAQTSTSHSSSMTTSIAQTTQLPPTPSSGRDSSGDNASTMPLPPTPGQTSVDMSSLSAGPMVGSSATSTTTPTGSGNNREFNKLSQERTHEFSQNRETNGNNKNRNGEHGHARKPSFTQKLKGEVKVIAGKLTKDQKKVEEGRALKAGELRT